MGGEFDAFSSASRWIMLPPQKHYTNLPGNLTKKMKCLGLGGLLGGMGGFGIDWYITVVEAV